MDWVDERIVTAQEKDRKEAKSQEWQLHKEKVFQAKMPILRNALFASLEQAVEKWNKAYSRNNPKWIESQSTPDGFLARRAQFPTRALRVWLDKDGHCIRFTLAYRVDRESEERETNSRFRIDLAEDEELHLFDGDKIVMDDVAVQRILSPLMQ